MPDLTPHGVLCAEQLSFDEHVWPAIQANRELRNVVKHVWGHNHSLIAWHPIFGSNANDLRPCARSVKMFPMRCVRTIWRSPPEALSESFATLEMDTASRSAGLTGKLPTNRVPTSNPPLTVQKVHASLLILHKDGTAEIQNPKRP